MLAVLLAGCAGTAPPRVDATDKQIIAEATREALERNRTGEGENWRNPANDHRGTVIPTRTFERSDRPCREFQQTATIAGRTLIAYDVACRHSDGTWKSEAYASLDGAIADAQYDRGDRYHAHRHDPFYRHPRFRFGYGYGFPRGSFWYYR